MGGDKRIIEPRRDAEKRAPYSACSGQAGAQHAAPLQRLIVLERGDHAGDGVVEGGFIVEIRLPEAG